MRIKEGEIMGGREDSGENCSDCMLMLFCVLQRDMFLHHIKAVLNPGLTKERKTKRALVVFNAVCFFICQ